MNSLNTSIVIFAHTRPFHLEKTLESLLKNDLSQIENIRIYIDGPRNEIQRKKVDETYSVANKFRVNFRWEVKKSNINLGLSNSIINGISDEFKSNEAVIIIEDDLVLSPNFVDFMTSGLHKFKSKNQVASIHGYLPSVESSIPPDEPFFIRGADCWGWATWKNRWNVAEWNATKLLADLHAKNLVYDFNLEDKFPFTQMLEECSLRKIDSWAIRWHAYNFLQNKLTLHPQYSLVSNEGFDNSGTHGTKTNSYKTNIYMGKIEIPDTIIIEESKQGLRYISSFYSNLANLKEPLIYRIRLKFSNYLKKWIKSW